MDAVAEPARTMRQKLRHELVEYATVALYLFICFAAVMSYKAAILQAGPIGTAPFAFAAVKAAILGKFVLIGNAFGVGERGRPRRLIVRILIKTGASLVMLMVLVVVEEVLVGLIHGRSLAVSLAGIGGGTWRQIVAVCVLLGLILLPYFGFRYLAAALGPGRMRQMLFARN